jgi:hypothetical protein
MGYLGENKNAINPNHPFAHSQVSFGMKRPGSSKSASEKPKVSAAADSDKPLPPEKPAEDSTPLD